MPLRFATWNVNSVRQRLDHIARFCAEAEPDVLCLQETKVVDDAFPQEELHKLGFVHRLIKGQKSYNGVAILSRVPFAQPQVRQWCRRDDCRHASVRLPGGIELHNFYVPSGGDVPDPKTNDKFDHKVRFLRAMARWCRKEDVAARKLVMVGDFNVAPLETDVWNHKRLLRSVGHSPLESDLMGKLLRSGDFIDAARHFVPPSEPLYTWWGYRFKQSLEKNYGWRLDHVWVTGALAPALKSLRVAKETRSWDKPSDHVPVVLDLE